MTKRQLIIRTQGGLDLGFRGHIDFQSRTKYANFGEKQIAYFTNTLGHLNHRKDVVIAGFVTSKQYKTPQKTTAIDIETIEDPELAQKIGRAIMSIELCKEGVCWKGKGLVDILK